MSAHRFFVAVLLFTGAAVTAGQTLRATVTGPEAWIAGQTRFETLTAEPSGEPPTRGGIPQVPGFPVTMGVNPQQNFYPARGLVFADLVGDADLEIVACSTNKRLYAWDRTGAPLPGFPVTVNEMAQYSPSVGDLDGDGDLEIVVCTRGLTSGGRLYAMDYLGNVLPGFPRNFNNNNVTSCATLYDLDDDGQLEIIVGERAYPIGYVHVVEPDGSEWGGNWPVALDHVPAASAAVGDVDDDGAAEVFYVSYNSMYLIERDGSIDPGWPKQIPNANFSYQSAVLADLDGDGDREIVVAAHRDAAGCYIFHHDGTTYGSWPRLTNGWTYCPPTVTDMESDGILEVLCGQAGGVSGPSNCFWVWRRNGATRNGFPYVSAHGGGSEGPLTVADVDGDGVKEIFADHNYLVDGQGFLFGVNGAGADLVDFPIRTQGFTYLNGAQIADVDRDGDYELGVLSYDGPTVYVNLYDLASTYAAAPDDWRHYHGTPHRGGLFPPPADGRPGDLDGDGDVDLTDLTLFLSAFGRCTGDPAFNPAADLDGSGCVDLPDLALLLAVFGT